MSKGVADVKKNLARKQSLVSNFMRSEAGREIMRVLEEEFCDVELLGSDPYQTYYNLGRRDMVVYLKQIANWREEEK